MLELPAMLGISAGTNVMNTAANWYWQHKNYEYQKRLQNQIFGREDTAIQRRVADLKAAGLSPVLAAGSGAEAGPVVSTKPPQLEGLGDLSNALEFMQSLAMEASIDKTKAENLVLDQQAAKVKSERYLTDLMAQKQAMDNKIQSTYGGVSNPSGPARWVRDAVGIGTGPIGDAAKSMAKEEVERRHEEPVKGGSLWDLFFGDKSEKSK